MTFPFTVRRSAAKTLTEQVTLGVRQAILCGDWAFGSRVPSLRQASRDLGVSYKVACAAYDGLCRDGWLRRLPRKGYTAAAPDVPLWRGEILLVAYGAYSDLQAVMGVQRSLASLGWLGICVFVNTVGADVGDYAVLDALLTRNFDLVVAFSPTEDVLSRIRYAEKPYVVMTSCRPSFGRLCRGVIHVRMAAAVRDLAEACRRLHVRTAWCVNFQPVHGAVRDALRTVGVRAKMVLTGYDPKKSEHNNDIRDRAFAWFSRFLCRRGSLPDLIVFLDDFVAAGALSALSAHGVRFPEDVQVVSFSNHDNGQSCARSLARIENDFARVGGSVAEYLVRCIERPRPRRVLELEAFALIPGETFSRVVGGVSTNFREFARIDSDS